ncbi:cation transporter [Ruminococcaceae bacterium OttesenSCG-928-I18]|nr:cation transporter [Ruminococcaceae bacterium OttesenSCG-928-I18]
MKKTYKLEDLECANCAAKMENALNQLEGVHANIRFMQQSMTFEAPDEQFDSLLNQAQKLMRKIEPDVRVLV